MTCCMSCYRLRVARWLLGLDRCLSTAACSHVRRVAEAKEAA